MNTAYTFTVETPPDTRDQEEVSSFLEDHWGSVNIASRGKLIDASTVPRVIARNADGTLVGLATFLLENTKQCELVSIDAVVQGVGIGSALLNRVEAAAKEAGCQSIWLITTNNNLQAQTFYEHKGYERTAVHENALLQSRKLKPGIPTHDEHGVAIRDEWEYRKNLV